MILVCDNMVVKKNSKGEWCTYHCHGPKKGEVITCFPTEKAAEKQHSAIMANKIEINLNKL